MKRLIALVVCFLLVGSVSVFAKTGKQKKIVKPRQVGMTLDNDKQGGPKISLSGEYSNIEYREPDFMQEKGTMLGISLDYQHDYSPETSVKLETKVSWGEVDYQSNGTGSMDDVEDLMIEPRLIFTNNYYYSQDKFIVTPYAGFGYRFLQDKLGGRQTTTGAYGYKREANYYYVPIGSKVSFNPGKLCLGFSLEYDYFIQGYQYSYLSDVAPQFNNIKNKQKEGYGARASLFFIVKGAKVDFVFEPFYKYWDIKDSETENLLWNGYPIGYGLEPHNISNEYGLKIGLKF